MEHFTQQWKKPLAVWAWALACAAGVTAVCSRSSFFYPLNNWGDAQCFFTVGKAMVRGQVLYRDIYEQKGPLVLFLHGLASLVQRNGFLGVFVLEVLAAAVFLWLCGTIMALYGAGPLRFAALPLLLAVSFSTPSFQMGDGMEELCLPLFAAGLYLGLRALHQDRPLGWGGAVALGVLCGAVFWTKYTLCGLFAAVGLVLFVHAICRSGPKAAARLAAGFLGGFALAGLPWLLYFGLNGALGDLWQCYFYNNLFLYGTGGSLSLSGVLHAVAGSLSYMLRLNWTFGIFAVGGLAWFVLWPGTGRSGWERVLVLACAVLMAVAIYGAASNAYIYYGMPFVLFVPLGFLALLGPAQALLERMRLPTGWPVRMAAAAALVLGVGYALWHTPNRQAFLQPLEQTVQYQFKQVVDGAEDRSMAMLHLLDGGFYTICDVMPTQKYIGVFNLPLAEMQQQMDDTLKNADVNFIVARTEEEDREEYKRDKEPAILEHYELVADGTEEYLRNKGYSTMHYYLYRRRV